MGDKQKKKKLTDAQKFSTEFEILSEQMVERLFEGTNAHIRKTDNSKDGGYDVIVEFFDGTAYRKIYFECKLRSDNLNLRDIAANLIIAFNEGAVALGIITNYDYTEQANENISRFCEKTVLNIKIIIGEDIQKLAEVYRLVIPDTLYPIITSKKTLGKKEYQFLRIDCSQGKLYDQFLRKRIQSDSMSSSYICQINEKLFTKAKAYLVNGKTICVQGLLGIGKTSFIRTVLSDLGCKEVHVVADNYSSQPQLLLGIFLDVWGIPVHNIVRDFSEDMVNKIISTIDEKSKEQRTGVIIKNLLGKSVPDGIADEHYNWLICNYLMHQLLLYRTDVLYVFYIENAEKATEEVQILLSYICKLLVNNHIGCIIEQNESEYKLMESNTINLFYKEIKNIAYPIILEYLSREQACEFVQKEMNGYPQHLQEVILKKGGVRLLTLNTLIEYVKIKLKQQGWHIKLLEELQAFTQNDIPLPISSLLDVYFNKEPDLFYCLSFFQGKMPFEWVDILVKESTSTIDCLLELRFLDMDDDCLIVANELIMEKISTFPARNAFSARKAAERLLSFLNTTQDECYIECKIAAYHYLKKYSAAFPLMERHMKRLWKERQYTSFLKYVNLALDMLKDDALNDRIRLVISGLKIWSIKKQANSPQAEPLFRKFQKMLCSLSGVQKEHYQMIYDFFDSKRLFKDCCFSRSFNLSESYYKNYLKKIPQKTEEEWEEKLCVVYALSVKELYGNETAMEVFDNLYSMNPDSFYFRLEWLSHRQCMNFYCNPKLSLDCINKIMDIFKNNPRDDYPLPYHEYVDRALCALCAKRYDDAITYSDDAIRILESNGIMPTLGRAYNIKGCTYLCLGKYEDAGRCIKEACFIMDEADYNLFSWRSRLNLLQLELTYHTGIITDGGQEIYDRTYMQFKEIYHEKIKALSQQESLYSTREYFALLMFGHISKLLKKDMTKHIIKDFLSNENAERYLEHLHQIEDNRIKKTVFSNCPYSIGKYLFMVG